MADYEDITYEVDEAVAIITINLPERHNASRGKTIEELVKAFRAAWADTDEGMEGAKAFAEKRPADFGQFVTAATVRR